MAEQESKKVDENNTEETSENETKTEESTASQDEASDTKQSNDKAPDKTKSAVKATKGKKQDEIKGAEEDDKSSDEEELVGILDAPLVVQGKRARKSTEFLSNTINTPQSIERKRIEIPEGKGETLGSMPRVQFQLNKIPGEELKPLHRILFGRPGNSSEVKRNIRLFNGFDIEKDSKEYRKKEELVDRFTQDSIKRLCEILDIEKKGKKEEVLERVMDFLLCPQASGKPLPEKGSKSKKPAKKRKRTKTPKKEKSKPKKAKSDETVESDGDSEEEEDEEEEEEEKEKEEPPEKKAKPTKKEKKEVKKPAKKEKKVVSIKISPGKKAKKAKEKKVESDDSSDEEPLSKKAKKSPPTNDEILELVKELLDGADLEKITMKSVCKQVYQRFPDFDLTDRKEFIKESVKEIIT